MESLVPANYSSDMKFIRMTRENNSWYAVYANQHGVEFKVTPMNQTLGGYPYVDLVSHIHRQRNFSIKTFGPIGEGQKPEGVIDHIEREIKQELRLDPTNLKEWIDLLILSLDGCIKSGHTPEEITLALLEKQTRNENRQWPDWRTMPKDKATEHIRTPEEQAQKELELSQLK